MELFANAFPANFVMSLQIMIGSGPMRFPTCTIIDASSGRMNWLPFRPMKNCRCTLFKEACFASDRFASDPTD